MISKLTSSTPGSTVQFTTACVFMDHEGHSLVTLGPSLDPAVRTAGGLVSKAQGRVAVSLSPVCWSVLRLWSQRHWPAASQHALVFWGQRFGRWRGRSSF